MRQSTNVQAIKTHAAIVLSNSEGGTDMEATTVSKYWMASATVAVDN
jgi:hypothetical protein